jgi:TctA family transporter
MMEKMTMKKFLVTVFCSALIAVSSIQMAAAAQHHAERHHVRNAVSSAAVANAQFRNSYAAQVRGSNASGMCGLFPGPCQ